PASSRRRRRHVGRHDARDGAHRGSVREVRRPPRPRLRRWAAGDDRAALLHQLGGAGARPGGRRVSSLVSALLADLAAESDSLDAVVHGLDDAAWHVPTPAEGWDVADTIAHLGSTDAIAVNAATAPDAFPGWLEREVFADLGAGYLVRQLDPAR